MDRCEHGKPPGTGCFNCAEREIETLRAERDADKSLLRTTLIETGQRINELQKCLGSAVARAETAEKALREAVADAYVEGFNDCAQRHTGLNEDFVIVEECYSVSIASRKLARAAGEGE
jgi:hypothetical protein